MLWPTFYDDLMDEGVTTYPYVVHSGNGIIFVEPDDYHNKGYLNINYTSESWRKTINVTIKNWVEFPCIKGYVKNDTYGRDLREPVYISFAWYIPIFDNSTFHELIGYDLEWMPKFNSYSAYEHTWNGYTLTVDFWMPI